MLLKTSNLTALKGFYKIKSLKRFENFSDSKSRHSSSQNISTVVGKRVRLYCNPDVDDDKEISNRQLNTNYDLNNNATTLDVFHKIESANLKINPVKDQLDGALSNKNNNKADLEYNSMNRYNKFSTYQNRTKSKRTVKLTHSWYFRGKHLNEMSNGLLSRIGVYADGSLVINDVKKEDLGWYKCEIKDKTSSENESNNVEARTIVDIFLNVACEFYSLV